MKPKNRMILKPMTADEQTESRIVLLLLLIVAGFACFIAFLLAVVVGLIWFGLI